MRASVVLLWLVGGCAEPADLRSGEAEPAGCPSGDLELQVGTGTFSYEPLVDGAEVVMVHGPQGGWHLDVSGWVGGAPAAVAVHPALTLTQDGAQVAGDQQPEFVALIRYDEEACTGEFWGRRAFINDLPGTDQAFICSLAGEEAVLTVRVHDPRDEREVVEQVDVVLRLDPSDVPRCGG